jgi:hypothetical protein
MPTKNFMFGGGVADTMLHPIVAVAMVITIISIFCLPRKHVIGPFLFTIFLCPYAQCLVVGGVHFFVSRILVMAGLMRLATARPSSSGSRLAGGFNGIDGAFVGCAFFMTLTFALLWMDPQALINKIGELLDAIGGYLFLRYLIQSREDVRRTIKILSAIAVVVAIGMFIERVAYTNLFGYLGGVGLKPAFRDGKPRAQGPFEVYVMAGAFGSTLLPLFSWLWKSGGAKVVAVLGILSSTVITVTSNTSTAVGAYLAGIIGLCFWPLRKRMRAIRWALVITLVTLHLVMKAPVWALIARIDFTGSSSGYQRYMLVDNCIRRFSSWWLLGVKDFGDWGWDMFDTSNQYVAVAENGGLISLVFFIAIISRSFGKLGTARKWISGNRKQEWLLWALGAALFAHVIAYIGISYADQSKFAWYVLLAMICAGISEARRSSVAVVPATLPRRYEAEPAMSWATTETMR